MQPVLSFSPTAEGGSEGRFRKGSARVPRGFHEGCARVPKMHAEEGSARVQRAAEPIRALSGISPELIPCGPIKLIDDVASVS